MAIKFTVNHKRNTIKRLSADIAELVQAEQILFDIDSNEALDTIFKAIAEAQVEIMENLLSSAEVKKCKNCMHHPYYGDIK